jgi:hypothetical protein
MHPIIERDVMESGVADLHRQAERDRIARAASRTPRTRQEKRRPNLMLSRRVLDRWYKGPDRLWSTSPRRTLRLDDVRPAPGHSAAARRVIATRRIGAFVALGALLSISAGVVTASPAHARGDGWQVAPAPPAITLPTAFCGFDLQITFPVNREFVKVLKTSDGSMILLATGFASASFTNLETRKTITENTSGPAKFVVSPDGSVTELEKGLNGLVLTPADAARFGLPTVSVTAGARTVSVASDGSITSLSLQGHVLVDVCDALS